MLSNIQLFRLFIYQIIGNDIMLQDLLSFWLFKMVQQNLCMRLSLDYILEKKLWMPLNQVALATDRASSMTGHRKREDTVRD